MEENIDISKVEIKNHPWYNKEHHTEKGFKNIYREHTFKIPHKGGFWLLKKIFEKRPEVKIPFHKIEIPEFKNPVNIARIFWLGHSTVLVQLKDKNIIFDPIFSKRASPVFFIGPKRKVEIPVEISDLPQIEAVIISHNHYDHLDKKSILKIKNLFNPVFIVPLGLKKKFLVWGIKNTVELDWGQFIEYNRTEYHCMTAQHFSSRGISDRNQTLWCSWYINFKENSKKYFSIYFAGDTGYSEIFKDIKKYCGPPDIAILPIGAYNPESFMGVVHMNPKEAFQAYLDISAKDFLSIHWGTFIQTLEPLDEPPELLKKEAKKYIEHGNIYILPVGGSINY